MTVTVRFAPSPTGRLHIGNIRTAILNWLFAHKHAGTFILRLDDTDQERSTQEFADAIQTDLEWLGLKWARFERQSLRLARYAQMAAMAKQSGRLYACYESEAELERKRKRQLARGQPPVYDRGALRLTAADRAQLEAAGRRPYWRFLLANSENHRSTNGTSTLVPWKDHVRGDQSVDLNSLSDPVLIRADGSYLYTFTSVVDDIDFAITHVIRGEDHVTNTGVQIQIFEALGARPPEFAHFSLLVDAHGHGLSKRFGSLSVDELRAAGLEPMAVASYAALISTSEAIAPHRSLDELSAIFDLSKLSRAPGRFELAELKALNAKLLHSFEYQAVSNRLAALGIGDGSEFWEAVRGNVSVLADAKRWWQIINGPVTPIIEDRALCNAALELLPPEPWSVETWGGWTTALKSKTKLKGRQLFHPLRLALTGEEMGPELRAILPLIGRARAAARLNGETA
jgi:glutamyl-tRNA synthetase